MTEKNVLSEQTIAGGRFSPDYKEGLTLDEVLHQNKTGNGNIAPEKITKSNSQIIKDNVLTLFNFYNFFIACCLFLVGAYSNMLFILVIIVNIIIGLAQEIHAKNLVEELSIVTAPKVTVVRAGKEQDLMVEELVLDDIVMFDSGKQIASDSIIVHGEVEVNESLLTGESDTVLKGVGEMLLSGSFVISGKCYAQVEHVGNNNFAVGIANEAKKHKQVNSELLQSMRKITRFTSFLIIPLGLIMLLQAYFSRGDSINVAVISTAAGLLGMLPKGLVLLISIALASGVIMLSRKKILVQELFALESLAHVDVLCLDKTGTITEGKMCVEDVQILAKVDLPEPFTDIMGSFLHNSDDNNATFLALKDYFTVNDKLTTINKIPFSSQRKWSAMTFSAGYSLVLGAPDRLTSQKLPEDILTEEKSGTRIIMAAFTREKIKDYELEGLLPIAYIMIKDPVRANAVETLNYFKNEGVEVKIISGDNPLTVSAIAQKAGLEKYADFVDMSNCQTEAEYEQVVKNYSVFGRVTPHQKSHLIKALKKQGYTVAMTGDGVNDVLALREADCSIAMAEGSDAAKQVSKLVLLNSDFASLVDVLSEGRRVVNNITKVASIFFIKTIYSVLLSIICIIANIPFPFIPLQIALIDVIIEGYPSFFMSFEKNQQKIKGTFLHSVFRRSIPNAVTIVANILLVYFISNKIAMVRDDYITVMYALIGFISIMAVVKISFPFNKFRFLLCSTMTIGFFGSMYIFHNFIHLNVLHSETIMFFAVMAFFSIVLERILTILTNKVMKVSTNNN